MLGPACELPVTGVFEDVDGTFELCGIARDDKMEGSGGRALPT